MNTEKYNELKPLIEKMSKITKEDILLEESKLSFQKTFNKEPEELGFQTIESIILAIKYGKAFSNIEMVQEMVAAHIKIRDSTYFLNISDEETYSLICTISNFIK